MLLYVVKCTPIIFYLQLQKSLKYLKEKNKHNIFLYFFYDLNKLYDFYLLFCLIRLSHLLHFKCTSKCTALIIVFQFMKKYLVVSYAVFYLVYSYFLCSSLWQ